MNRTAILTAALFTAGAGLAAAGYRPYFWGWAVIGLIWIGAVLAGRRKTAIQLVWLSLALLAGNGCYAWADARLASAVAPPSANWNPAADEAGAELSGRLDTPVEVDGDRAVFYMRTEKWSWADGGVVRPQGELVYVTVRLREQEEQVMAAAWRRGDRVELAGTVKTPEPARNFGGFDFREYLRKKDVHWMVTVKGASAVRISPPGRWDAARLLRWNDHIREGAGSRLASLFPGDEAGYMKGLLIGLREDLDPERFRNFSRLGLTHILAISGLHVGVFLWAVTALCRRLGVTRETAARIGFWAIPLYVVFTGSSPSVVRSGLTAMAGLYAARKGWPVPVSFGSIGDAAVESSFYHRCGLSAVLSRHRRFVGRGACHNQTSTRYSSSLEKQPCRSSDGAAGILPRFGLLFQPVFPAFPACQSGAGASDQLRCDSPGLWGFAALLSLALGGQRGSSFHFIPQPFHLLHH